VDKFQSGPSSLRIQLQTLENLITNLEFDVKKPILNQEKFADSSFSSTAEKTGKLS